MDQTTLADDDRPMRLAQEALELPKDERLAFIRKACQSDHDLFVQAWQIVQAEERMEGFLKTPVICRPDPTEFFEPGQLLIGRFRIVREIGRGGMGIVWEAYDEKVKRRVAIKCAQPGFSRQLPPEVKHASEISHENVCKLFDIHTTTTALREADFACMEFIDGETLTDRLQAGPIPKKERTAVALQICGGLAAAHSHGVIHGDLKSLNIMLTAGSDGGIRAVIMDFGLARMGTNAAEGGRKLLAGTPAYMAPELWQTAESSVKSDIYALGVVLWELVSGKDFSYLPVTPSRLQSPAKTIYKAPNGFGRWDHVFACCLEEDPGRRFGSAEEVARAIRPPRSRKWFIAAAAALILALATGVAAYITASIPAKAIRLAALPFEVKGKVSNTEAVTKQTLTDVANLRGDRRTSFSFIPLSKVLSNHVDTSDKALKLVKATHVLRTMFVVNPNSTSIHASLIDAAYGAVNKEWNAEYTPAEMVFAPRALAGFVTETFGLPIAKVRPVNSAAQADYAAGVAALAWESRLNESLGFFERAVSLDSESPLTHAGLAEAEWAKYNEFRDKKWLEQTIESVGQANKRDPDLAECHLISGLLKADAGLYEDAQSEFLRASELKPGISAPYRRLGKTYEQSDQIEKAQTAFEKAVDIEPNQYRNHIELGYFYHQRAMYEEALANFERGVKLAPKEASVHYDLGVELSNLGRFSDAERELRTSIALQEKPDVLNTLGVVLIYERREQEAIPIITRTFRFAQNWLWWMDLGTAYRRAHFSVKAKEAYGQALKLAEADMSKNPRSGSLRANLAFLCSQLGQDQRAESEIAQALRLAPRDSDTVFMAATTYEALGQRKEALEILASGPDGVISDISRWPDMAEFCEDSRFLLLLAKRGSK